MHAPKWTFRTLAAAVAVVVTAGPAAAQNPNPFLPPPGPQIPSAFGNRPGVGGCCASYPPLGGVPVYPDPFSPFPPFTQFRTTTFSSNPFVVNAFARSPFANSPFLTRPVGGPFVANPFLTNPFVTNPFVVDPFVNSPFVANPFVANPFAPNPLAVNPFGPNPFGPNPFGPGFLLPGWQNGPWPGGVGNPAFGVGPRIVAGAVPNPAAMLIVVPAGARQAAP